MSQPVITLTLNPALDQTVTVPLLRTGAVNLASEVHVNAGGKGVNVASCLADWGVPVVASGLLGRDNTTPFEDLFADKGIRDAFIRVGGSTRTNIKLVDASTLDTTDINLPGIQPSTGALAKLQLLLDEHIEQNSLAVLAGSLPAGVDDGCWAQYARQLRQLGARVVLDTSGPALQQALAPDALPWLIKPNQHELEQYLGRALPDLTAIAAAARQLQQRGIAVVVVSLGSAGALLCCDQGCWLAEPLQLDKLKSTVGAGDALVAGLVAALHATAPGQTPVWPEVLRLGMAFAAAKLAHIGPHLPDTGEVARLRARIQVTPLTP
ncbi:1-phosphofructokinase [Vogesella sp. DC21W]|uniref:Phosphofructokinase n=1 Tax=Vogesella aquatica TaxID=2984206 RepID=A0ABT5IVP4_9NEIS|nr:1-phosphofructokinase [Vogesella aquatica]MDC7716641.1 1-phosphofructokinase [Vogesella aquatica]